MALNRRQAHPAKRFQIDRLGRRAMGRLDGDHVARPPSNCPPPKTANCPHWAAGAAACEEWAAAGAVKIYEQLS